MSETAVSRDRYPSTVFGRIKPYVYWGISVVCFLVQLSIQVSSGMLAKQLAAEFSLSASSVGLLLAMVFLPNILLQIPAGMITDRFGARKVLSIGALVCAAGSWGFAHSDSFYTACLFRVVMGSGLSFAFVSMAYLLANWMRKEVFSVMLCIAEMCVFLFTILMMKLLAVYLPEISWRAFVRLIAYIALSLSVIACVVVRDRPDYLETESPRLQFSDILGHLGEFVRDYRMWANGVYSGCLFASLSCFVAVWGPTFLSHAKTMNLEDAASMCVSLTFGLAVGCPLLGFFLPRIENIRGVLALFSLGCAICISFVVMFPMMDPLLLRLTLFFGGVFAVAYLVSFTIVHHYVRPGSKSTAIGFTNMLSTLFGPLLSLSMGVLADRHKMLRGATEYLLSDYQYAMNILPMALFAAALLCFFVPNTHRMGTRNDL